MSREHAAILLIEDNPGDARLIREMLPAGTGAVLSLEWVDSLEAGQRRIAQGGVDLVLLDLGLPESTGLETLRHLRVASGQLPAVVVLSGAGDEAIGAQAVLEGAQDYLIKGQVDGSLLIRSIRYAIERNAATVALWRAHNELENQVAERTSALARAVESLQSEVAERKRAEEAQRRLDRKLRAVSDCNQTLLRATDERVLLNEICRIVCDEAGYRMAWVGYAENDDTRTVRPVAWAGAEDGYLKNIGIVWSDTEFGRGPTGTAIRTGKTSHVRDFVTDPKAEPWRTEAARRGYRCNIALPLVDEAGTAFGALTIYSAEPDSFTPDEIRLLEELAGDLAFGIEVLRTRTERRRAKERLQRSENAMAEAQRIVHLGNWKLDLVNNVLTWSDEIYRIFEIDPHKFGASYEAFLNAVHPEDREMVNKAYSDSVRNKSSYDIVHRLKMPDGRIKYVNERGETHYGPDGKPLHSIGTVHDITERKRVQDALRASEEKYRRIVETAQEGIWMLGADLMTTFVNARMAEMTGYAASELLGRPFTDLMFPEDVPDHHRRLKLRAQGVSESYERRIRRKDGRTVWVYISATPVFDEAHRFQGTLAMFTDITGRKRAEDALVFVAQRGWQSGGEDFFPALAQLLGEKLDMDYVLVDRLCDDPEKAETVALYAKGAITPNMSYALRGTPCENVMGKGICIHLHGIQQAFPEDALLREMGAESYIGIPLWDSTGRPIGLIACMSTKPLSDDAPVTELLQLVATRAAAELERRRAEDQIRRLNQDLERRVSERTAQLEAANKELETFAYSVSHDLRTPLRGIDGFSQALLDDYSAVLDETGKRYLHRVRAGAQQMAHLIDDMLNLARVTRGEMTTAEVDLSKLAQETADELRRLEPGRKVRFTVAPGMVVTGDGRLLRIALQNLIGNAWKFTSKREEATIEFGTTEKDGERVFFVRDNGAGFEMEYASRLFGVFQRLHTTEEFPGTGVGLATVQRIIHRHGGRVWAEGEVDRGATFYFSQPNRWQ